MTEIWAHRGASGDAPENTLPAFELAIEQGADGIELDLQRSADGHLVVIHDETIDRTSDGSGKVAALTLEELRRFDYGNGMPGFEGTVIPTLREVLELLEPTRLTINIELKNSVELYPGMEAEAKALVEEFGLAHRVIYSSFNHYSLRSLRSMSAEARLGVLYSDGMVDPWVYASYLGVDAIHPPYQVLQVPGVVDECHARGVWVHPWTVPVDQTGAVASLGVDAIITNHPGQARHRLPSGQPGL